MKLFLSVALILFVTVSFGDCGPKPSTSPKGKEKSPKSPKSKNSPKSPKGDASHELTDAIGALSLDGLSHGETSQVYQFASAVKDIISKNYQMYNQIKEYTDRFSKHDADWSPIELIIIKMKMTFDISDSQELTALKKQYNTYKPKLDELLKKIKPAHEQNQKLAESVNAFIKAETKVSDLTVEPKVDPKLSEELLKEAQKVSKIFEEFEKVMESFQMGTYIQKLENVRAAIVELKGGRMYLDQAEQIFGENVEGSEELVAPNVQTLDAALKIHYADLTKANQQLQGLVKKAMHVHEPAKNAKK